MAINSSRAIKAKLDPGWKYLTVTSFNSCKIQSRFPTILLVWMAWPVSYLWSISFWSSLLSSSILCCSRFLLCSGGKWLKSSRDGAWGRKKQNKNRIRLSRNWLTLDEWCQRMIPRKHNKSNKAYCICFFVKMQLHQRLISIRSPDDAAWAGLLWK